MPLVELNTITDPMLSYKVTELVEIGAPCYTLCSDLETARQIIQDLGLNTGSLHPPIYPRNVVGPIRVSIDWDVVREFASYHPEVSWENLETMIKKAIGSNE